jgi:hypothetical protein
MAGATNFLEEALLNAMFRHVPSTAINAGNASTTNILVTSSTGFVKGLIVQGTTAGSFHQVTDVPDATHVTVTPAFGAAPTTGNLTAWAYAPIAVYAELFTANPTDAGGGTEVATGDYARKQLTQASGTWGAPSGAPRTITNSAAVEWLAVTWSGTVTGFGLNDSLTAGNLLLWFDSVDVVVASGNNVRFLAAALGVSFD